MTERSLGELARLNNSYRAEASPRQKLFKPRFKAEESTLKRLQTRRKVTEELIVTPEMAAKVVRDYLLPLFERTKRSDLNKSRQTAFGLESLTWDDTADTSASEGYVELEGGSLYTELKLSEQMYEEVSKTRIELEVLRRRLKEAEQKKESSEWELKRAQKEGQERQNALKLALHECSENLREVQGLHLERTLLGQQLAQSQAQRELLERKCKEYVSILHEERAKSDIRFFGSQLPLTRHIKCATRLCNLSIRMAYFTWKMR